jgi:hypothetical protein
MSSTGLFTGQSPLAKFEAGFNDGRVRQPTVYWQPTAHNWHDRGSPAWKITGISVAKVPLFGPQYDNIKYVFGEVEKTAELLVRLYGDALHWNPRDGVWVTAAAAGKETGKVSLPPCVDDMKRELDGLNELYKNRVLQEREWRAQRQRVIENCLGETEAET